MSSLSHHLIVGGQRSGKSRHAERLALGWLAQSPSHRVTVVATAMAGDEEMRARIARHRQDRPAAFTTLEAPAALGEALAVAAASPETLVLVDCLTLWLCNLLMGGPQTQALDEMADGPMQAALPPAGADAMEEGPSCFDGAVWRRWQRQRAALLAALASAAGPVVLVSNEIGWGVIPMGAQVRHVVDELGRLNQDVAQRCGQLTLMVAGQAWSRPVEVRSC